MSYLLTRLTPDRTTNCRSIIECYSEAGFEAVEGRPVGGVLVSPLAEEQGVVVEEEVSLHGLEPGQLLHPHRRPLMADPHAEASLHHHPAQLAEVTLGQTDRQTDGRHRTSAILAPQKKHVTFCILNHFAALKCR